MEIQWPLLLFTTFLAWSAGLFATQCFYAIKKQAGNAQKTALIASAALLVVGGISVFFHLEHWERIFNGFGQLNSGITQELIAIIVLFVIMLVYFVYVRRDEENPQIPQGLAIVGIIAAAVLVVVMGHSYMMASRPAWNSIIQVLSLLGAAVAFGVATMTIIAATKGDSSADTAKLNIIAQAINAVCLVLYLIVMQASDSAMSQVQYWFDLTQPTLDISAAATTSPFAGEAMIPAIIAIIAALAGVASAYVGKGKTDWKTWGAIGLGCVFVSAIALRAGFYVTGLSVYPFF